MKSIVMLLMRILVCLLIAVVVAFGGASSPVTRLFALTIWLLLLVVIIVSRHRVVFAGAAPYAIGLAGGCIGWTYLQVSERVWAVLSTSALLPASMFSTIGRTTLSIAPADTIQTVVALLLPIGMFIAVLHAFRDEDKNTLFIGLHAIFGTAIAVYGVAIYATGNDWLLFSEKRFYLRNLTSVFINRNTAANYFGIALSCMTALAVARTQQLQPMRQTPARRQRHTLVLGLYIAGWLAIFSALMLTSSRAGAATAILSVAVIVLLCVYARPRDGDARARRPRWQSLLPAIAILLVILLLTLAFASPIFFRIQADWNDDPRFCIMPGLVRLWLDNWLFGTGLGTFPLAFPPYKNAACGLAELWLQAHNVYLEGAITLGLPFLVVLPVLLALLFGAFIRGLRTRRRYRWVSALGIGLLLQQILHNAIDFPIQNVAIAVVFASLMAACVSVSLRRPDMDVGWKRRH